MKTPIFDFVSRYSENECLRLHMPGHKGKSLLGFEKYDITEIEGADCLYHASGIIEESQISAARLFGSGKTVYSCEGSSLSIRAMMHLIRLYRGQGYVLAGRNAHSSFISACALNGLEIQWIYPEEGHIGRAPNVANIEHYIARVDEMIERKRELFEVK
jgi:arginine/lysine/ornithine decarboxylase